MVICRLRVSCPGKASGFGTAWIAGSREVVTAFHVVGSIDTKTWLSDEAEDCEYHLERGEEDLVLLMPAIADPQADLAVLRAESDLGAPPLPLADAPAKEGEAWSSEGYPKEIGDSFTVHGKVSAVKPSRSGKALQLMVDQGTDIYWVGVSGAPVRIDGRVVGVVNRQRSRVSTIWASSLEALQELIRLSVHHADLVDRCQKLLVRLYDSLGDLRQLAKTLGWQVEWETDISHDQAARQLSRRGFREGAKAFLEMLRELEIDEIHVQDLDVGALEKRFQRLIEPEEEPFGRPSRDRIVAEIIRLLSVEDCPGVALFQPLGFGGHRILGRVLEVLQEPNRKKLPMRLVPDRRGLDEARLYGTLLRGLRRGLERQTTKPLAERWEAAFPKADRPPSEEDFELTLERLLEGPLETEQRTLILAMAELGRVEQRYLHNWEHIFKRLIRADGLPLQFLLLGGQELHDIYFQGALDLDADSPWEDLERKELGPLLRGEVEALVKEQDGEAAWVDPLLEVTGGHPALAEELLERGRQELSSADQDGLKDWVLASWLLQRLKKLVDQEPGLTRVLQRFANGDLERREGDLEERLFWLGVVKRDGPRRWRWISPVFAEWVKGW